MKKLRNNLIKIVIIFVMMFSFVQPVFAHGLIYDTKSTGDNKIRITLKWSTASEAKGIEIKSYYLRNGKVLYISYDIKDGAPKTAYLDYDLASAIPPIRVMLIKTGNEDVMPFTDISGIEQKDYIKHLHDAGIINGGSDGKFRPDDKMTRLEFVSIISKILSLKTSTVNSAGLKDIDKNSAKGIILAAVNKGLIDGFSDKTFRPNTPVTVAEVSRALYKSFKFKTTGNGVYMKLKINKWYSDYVKKMFDTGILNVNDSIYKSFDEESGITRANAAMMISRALSTY